MTCPTGSVKNSNLLHSGGDTRDAALVELEPVKHSRRQTGRSARVHIDCVGGHDVSRLVTQRGACTFQCIRLLAIACPRQSTRRDAGIGCHRGNRGFQHRSC